MKKIALVLSAALPLLAFVPAEAQKLEPGKWTGTVTPPGEQTTLAVTYDVTVKGDTISITVNAAEHGSHPFSDVKLADSVLQAFARKHSGEGHAPCDYAPARVERAPARRQRAASA